MSEFYLLSLLSELSLIFIIILNIKLTLIKSFKRHSLPGPRPLPVIGNLHIINLKRPYETMLKLSQKYGSIFSLRMGPKKVVVLTGYKTVKDALVNHSEEFGERAHMPIFEKLYEEKGIIFSHGENWKIIRRFTLTALKNFGMGKRVIEKRIVEECQHLIQVFGSHQGKPFEMNTIMNAPVANIIVSILFGKRFDYRDPQFLRLLHLIGENVLNMFPALGFFLQDQKTLLNNRDEFLSFIRMTFLRHLQKLDKNDQRSFIDAFLTRQQEEKDKPDGYLSNDNLVTLGSNLFAAGTETTSSTLCWGILLMIKYPEIQILQHQTQWEKPYTFNPQHFLSTEGKFVKREAFLPFSAGQRMCAGESLAKMELFLFFTSLFQKFNFHLPPGVSNTDLDLTPKIGFTLWPMPGKICTQPYS